MMMGLTVSATVSNTDKAASAVMLLLIPQIILSGALVPMSKIQPGYLKCLYHLAISKWSYELIGGRICAINDKLASEKAIIRDLQGDFSVNWFVLIGFILLFYIATTVAMKRKS
jgi:ABC-type multidrug transport system permease subunit